MAYLVAHHGAFWFQIRVPARLVDRYGRLIRENLQTQDRAVAQPLAHQLAGQWLLRFATDRMQACEPSQSPAYAAACAAAMTTPSQTLAPVIPLPATGVATVVSHAEPVVADDRAKGREIAASLDSLLRYWRTLHPECSRSTSAELESVVKDFTRTQRKPPAQLERFDITAYRDRLISVGLAHATVAKKVSFVSTLLQTAVDAGALLYNVARGLRIPKPKVASVGRRGFTTQELQRIFVSSVYSKRQRPTGGGGEAAAWVPMIALCTGARLEEICQLKVSDISLDDEHGPLLRISDGDGQRVKTVSSRRIVPLHHDLIAAGLLRYHEEMEESGHEWLFPALEPDHDGRRGGNFSKWFARNLRSPKGCAIRDPAVVFHSFRHTFKTLCREAGISEETHDALTGHAGVTVGRTYGHMPLTTLVQAVARIRFPVPLPPLQD